MSVLIKGVDMPKMPDHIEQGIIVPYIDVRIFADGTAVTSKNESPYYKQFTAVPVPTPHGRLIDADALTDTDDVIHKTMLFGGQIVYAQAAIDNAPTVIEAEGENKR